MSEISLKYPRFLKEIEKFPKHEYWNDDHFLEYGTAGFRCKAEYLDSCLYRMGMLAVLRSRASGSIIGVMVTASHNIAEDNGVKLIEAKGEMFQWEEYASELVNAANADLGELLDQIILKENIDMDRSGNIFIARDTRNSSERLSELVREGALLLGGNVLDFSLLTTPQLHHLVRMWNNDVYNRGDWASEIGYYNMLVDGYRQLVSTKPSTATASSNAQALPLLIDAAHGVGAMQVRKLMTELNSTNNAIAIPHEIRNDVMNNDDNDKYLNNYCGADFVQKAKTPPTGFEPAHDKLYPSCSLDGDADRIIYHYFDASGNWHYVDGDKMASLFALFVSEQLSILEKGNEISFGVIQTAYSNGASTLYLKSLGIPVLVAKTGVKHCHEKTKEFDISMYFEANGHGTIIYQDKIYEKLASMESKISDEKKKTALTALLNIYQIMNQAVGDAFSNLLLTEGILRLKEWSIVEWDRLYQDLPSRQTKVYIEDKNILKCNEEETQILEPYEIQETINNYVSEIAKGRAFVRPSGTENAVRIYAEAATQANADDLALKIAQYIHQNFKGIDECPQTFVA